MFKCDCCGLCCMNLKMSDLYVDLDRGDGICKFFDVRTKLCAVYKERPDKCNVDTMYEEFYKKVMSLEEYYKLNYQVCKFLKGRQRKS